MHRAEHNPHEITFEAENNNLTKTDQPPKYQTIIHETANKDIIDV